MEGHPMTTPQTPVDAHLSSVENFRRSPSRSNWDAVEASARALAATPAKRCPYCDDTGDVHSIDGEWRGRCTCPAGQYAPNTPTAPAQDARWWSPPDSFAKNWLTNGAALHPLTINLVVRFARALAAKLAAAEVKYGYSDGWRSADWMDECRAKLAEHVAKGDPRDVAAYCAFLWHHGESTAATPSTQSSEGGTEVSALKAYLKECDECCIVPDVGGAFAYAWRAALRASSPADTRNALRADHPLARGQCIHNVPMSEHCGACSPKEPQPGAIISGYTITEGFDGVKVERAQQMEGPAKWAVRRSGNVLSRSGEWDWEPTPSSRTHEWLAEHRFDTASEAIDAAHGIVTKEST